MQPRWKIVAGFLTGCPAFQSNRHSTNIARDLKRLSNWVRASIAVVFAYYGLNYGRLRRHQSVIDHLNPSFSEWRWSGTTGDVHETRCLDPAPGSPPVAATLFPKQPLPVS